MPVAQLLSVRLRVRLWVLRADALGCWTFAFPYRSMWIVPVVDGDLESRRRHRSAHCWFEDACMPAFDWRLFTFRLPFRWGRAFLFELGCARLFLFSDESGRLSEFGRRSLTLRWSQQA